MRASPDERSHLGPRYASASRTLVQWAWKNQVPVFCSLEVSLRCNLRCAHCYNFERSGDVPAGLASSQLSTAELLDAVDALAEAGCMNLTLTGGEPLAFAGLDAIIARARSHFLAVSVRSNGILLSEARARELYAQGVYGITISLYGTTAAVHDAFTTQAGSFASSMRGIEAAIRSGLRTNLAFNLTRHNAHQAGDMLRLGERLDCSVNIDPQLTTRYDGDPGPLTERIDRKTLAATYRGPLRALQPTADHDPRRSVQCSCARSVCAISATGDVYPCIGAPVPSGNLRNAPFSEIWRSSPQLAAIRALELEDFSDCAVCPDRPWCRRSSGVVFSNTGNYTGAEPWTCMEASVLRELDEQTEPSREGRFDSPERHR